MSEILRISAPHRDHFKPSPVVDGEVADDEADIGNSMSPHPHFDCLTRRQLEVLKLVGLGLSTKQIARQLFLSVKSVGSHQYRLMKKLGIHDRVHLCRYAIRQGLIKP